MASVGAGEEISAVDGTGNDSDTQSPSTSSSSSVAGNKLEDGSDEELQTLQFTAPFNDTIPVDRYLPHTQLLNHGDETQVLDYQDGDEGMTQLVNWCDDEMLTDNDSQGTDRTQVLTDDDDSKSGIGNDEVELEISQISPPINQAEKDHIVDSVASTGDEHGSDDQVTAIESEKRALENSPEAEAIREALNPWRGHDKQTRKNS